MPIDLLVLSSALLTGLLGGAHCALMCGGIASTLNSQSRNRALPHALVLNIGRIGSYTVAGILAGGIGSLFVSALRWPLLPILLRSIMGLVLMAIALRIIFPRQFAFGTPGNTRIWHMLSGIKSKLPQTGLLHSLTLGAIWGWLPCGLSGSMLLAAWFEADAVHSGLLMLAFGLGTLPLMTIISYSGAHFARLLNRKGLRYGFAGFIFLAGLLTALAPWLAKSSHVHAVLEVLGCRSLI